MENIAKKTWFGLAWSSLGAIVQVISQAIQLLVLAKMMGPTTYGEAMIGIIAVRMMMPLSAAGMGTVLIQEEGLNDKKLSALWFWNFVFAVFCYSILYLLSPFLADFLGIVGLEHFIRVGGLVVLIGAMTNVYGALLNKYLRFEVLNKIIIVGSVCELVFSLSIAYLGYMVWALLLGFLLRTLVIGVLYFWQGRAYFSYTFSFGLEDIRGILSKCFYDMATQLANMLAVNMDNLLIGKYFGITNLGYYALAWDLALKPVYAIVPIVTRVKFPIWAKLKGNRELLDADYGQTVLNIMKLMTVVFGLWYVVSTFFIPFWYGDSWKQSLVYLHILIWLGLARCFGSPSSYLGMVMGYFKEEFFITLLHSLLLLVSFFVVYHFFPSLSLVCWVVFGSYFMVDLVWYAFLERKSGVSIFGVGKKVLVWVIGLVCLVLLFERFAF